MPTHRIIKRDGLNVAEEIKRIQRDFGGQLRTIYDADDYIELVFNDVPETRGDVA